MGRCLELRATPSGGLASRADRLCHKATRICFLTYSDVSELFFRTPLSICFTGSGGSNWVSAPYVLPLTVMVMHWLRGFLTSSHGDRGSSWPGNHSVSPGREHGDETVGKHEHLPTLPHVHTKRTKVTSIEERRLQPAKFGLTKARVEQHHPGCVLRRLGLFCRFPTDNRR